MGVVYPDLGEQYLLDRLLAPDPVADILPWHLRLFANNYTPAPGSVIADFTEAVFAGYAAIDLTQSEWQPAENVSGQAVSQWSASFLTFAMTGGSPATIFGWYITDNADTVVVCAERFGVTPVVSPTEPLLFFLALKMRGSYPPGT